MLNRGIHIYLENLWLPSLESRSSRWMMLPRSSPIIRLLFRSQALSTAVAVFTKPLKRRFAGALSITRAGNGDATLRKKSSAYNVPPP